MTMIINRVMGMGIGTTAKQRVTIAIAIAIVIEIAIAIAIPGKTAIYTEEQLSSKGQMEA